MRRRPITKRYHPPKLPSTSQSEPAPSGGRPPLRCRKPTYPELERAIALLDQEMEKEGPIEDLYSIFQRKLIENVKYGLGFVLGSDQESVVLAERWLRAQLKEADVDTSIMLSLMLAGYLGANLVELDGAVWSADPDEPRARGRLRLPDGNFFEVFSFTLEWSKQQDWNLSEQYAEVRAGILQSSSATPSDSVRARNHQRAQALGLTVSVGLPVNTARAARPAREIALRIVALKVLIGYVAMPPEALPTATIQAQIQRLRLGAWFAPDERAIMQTQRSQAHQTHLDTIGWSIESLAVLCWCLNAAAPMDGGVEPLSDENSLRVVMKVAPPVSGDVDAWLNAAALRDLDPIHEMEDLYYCLHNAARNAQLTPGSAPGFQPERHGVVIQTRRRALTRVFSPGVAWADTDAST